MYYSFDAFEYIAHVRARWLVIAVACVSAAALALGISLLLPKQYTATASVIIEPPGGSDARLNTAVSGMYLESLKTYELFATGDTLFAKAADRFHLRQNSSQSIESLKRQVLKVAKLRDTKVLEISATLPDPVQAQALAQYLATETVNISRAENFASDRDFIETGEKQAASAKQRLEELEKASNTLAISEPVDSLQSEMDAEVELRSRVEEQLVAAEAEVAEYRQQSQDGSFAREQLAASQARVALLTSRSLELQRAIQAKATALATRTGRRDALAAALNAARRSYEAVTARLLEAQASAGTHAERLRIIDPGIVPQRPSSPHVALNVAVALLVALIASIVYLSGTFVFRRRQARFEPFERELRSREIEV
jgi:polysaccharide biosynthesis transport protein